MNRSLDAVTGSIATLNARRFRERFERELAANRFVLFVQSIVPVATGADAGYREILIRYKDEERNMQSPGTFLLVLEEQGLMPLLDRWIVSRVLKWIRQRDPGLDAGHLPRCSVNLSASTLQDHSAFAGYVQQEMRGLAGVREPLSFEVSVTDILSHSKDLARLAPALRSCGCTFSLSNYEGDDRSFDLARSLGFSIVKFDGSVLARLADDALARTRLETLARRCAGYGLGTVATHVESPETLPILESLGVDYAQGFGVDRPRLLAFRDSSGID